MYVVQLLHSLQNLFDKFNGNNNNNNSSYAAKLIDYIKEVCQKLNVEGNCKIECMISK